MAKKIDLSALTKEDRVDVNYKLNQPEFSPMRIQSGDYRVAVQGVGKSPLSQLASGLSKFSTALAQYNEAEKQAGIKEAEGFKAETPEDLYDELKREDPLAFLAFSRRKAYRNALYKRAMNYDILPSLSTDSEGLLNLNEFGAETDQFLAKRLDPYLEKKWGDFSEKVGDYANDPAAQALWTATTSEWRGQMVDNYNRRVEDFNYDAQKQELGLQLEAMGRRGVDDLGNQLVPDFSTVPDVLQNRDNLLAEDGMNPRDRTNLMATEVAAQATALLAAGRIKDASTMIALAEATKINGKPVFRTGASAKQFADLKLRVDNADASGDEKTNAEIRRTFTGQALVSYENLNAVGRLDELDNFTRQTIVSTFETLNPEITDEEIEANLAAIFDHPVSSSEGFDQALQQIALNAGDFGNSLYFDTKADVNRRRLELQRREVITTSLTQSEKENNLTEFAAWKRDNPQRSAKQWISSQGLNIPLFKELRDKDAELSRGNWIFDNLYYKNADDTLATALDAATGAVVAGLEKKEADPISLQVQMQSSQLEPQLLLDVQEYARTLDPDLPTEERDLKIKNFVNETVGQMAVRSRDFAEAYKKRAVVEQESSLMKIAMIKEADPKAGKIRYKHLTNENAKYSPAVIEKERETMLANRHLPQLQLSLINQGFAKWDPESWRLLDETALGVQDVRLFGSEGELDSVTSEWKEVMSKELSLEDLTEDEEAVKDLFQDFGIYDYTSLNMFIEEQRFFLQDTD